MRSAANTDCYTIKGEKREVFVPSGACHGFRYVEISGNGYGLSEHELKELVVEVEGLVITNTTDVTGNFRCSNGDVNKLQSNIMWGQRGNSLLVYTDCPQRNERMGWTGDAQVFVATAAYNMDIKTFMEKWLTDLRDAQLMYNRDGAVPDTAPLGGDNRRMGGCAGWGDAAVIVPWKLYLAAGDIGILQKNYDMMRAWVEYQSRADRQFDGVRTVDGEQMPDCSENFIQIQQSRGDHLTFDASTPFILTATAYAAYVAGLLARTAELLGKTDDAKRYTERYENVKRAFNEAWVCEDGSLAYWGEMSKSEPDSFGNIINRTRYAEGEDKTKRPSQTAYALALDFELIPEEKREMAAKR
jgi:alpha-L-rhamnosidase